MDYEFWNSPNFKYIISTGINDHAIYINYIIPYFSKKFKTQPHLNNVPCDILAHIYHMKTFNFLNIYMCYKNINCILNQFHLAFSFLLDL